jgi:2-polyprenyl-6-methoxyphenol hydroxylase-like FAD-dependent oxidoreductase
MATTQVLIVGAGPTGLVLALWLTRLGMRVRIIDKTSEPGTTSRALVVHARTLEFYRQVGLADDVMRLAREFVAANLWVKGRRVGRVEFGAMGEGLSPYPFMTVFPQDEHERLLIDRLTGLGVAVERDTELIDFEERNDRVVARVRRPDSVDETWDADYLAGCDGAHSTIRQSLSIGFPGGTYERMFYVADTDATGSVINGELHVALDDADFVGVFPLRTSGTARLIGTVRDGSFASGHLLTWDDVGKTAIERVGVRVDQVNWFSTYHVHHRVAEQFRRGRAFLLGDAAHIHSPVGGQGMNTGIGDAVNLAWKLAVVLGGRAPQSLLDSYEPERIAFARRLVATTDQAFTVATSPGRIAWFVRVVIVPRLLPLVTKLKVVRRFMFRTVSQIAINYRDSPLSRGTAGGIKAGDRLPWVPGSATDSSQTDNFAPLASVDWQVHIYGTAPPELVDVCRQRGLALHVFPWTPAVSTAGLRRDALYLVRPDGYVGLADPEANHATLEQYLSDHGA